MTSSRSCFITFNEYLGLAILNHNALGLQLITLHVFGSKHLEPPSLDPLKV